MGGGDYHLGEKPDSIFLLCQNIGLSLFGVCLFFGGFWCIEKLGLPREKKIIGGKTWAGPSCRDRDLFQDQGMTSGLSMGLLVVLPPAVVPSPFELALAP